MSLTPASGPSLPLPPPCVVTDGGAADGCAGCCPDGSTSDTAAAADCDAAVDGRQRRVSHCLRRLAGLTSTKSTCRRFGVPRADNVLPEALRDRALHHILDYKMTYALIRKENLTWCLTWALTSALAAPLMNRPCTTAESHPNPHPLRPQTSGCNLLRKQAGVRREQLRRATSKPTPHLKG